MNHFSDLPITYWISLDHNSAKLTRSILLVVAPAMGNRLFNR